jgi:hypothetical protein
MKEYLGILEEKVKKIIPTSIYLRPLDKNINNSIVQPNFMIHMRHSPQRRTLWTSSPY